MRHFFLRISCAVITWAACLSLPLSFAAARSPSIEPRPDASPATADQLVAAALSAEAEGRGLEREMLLQLALWMDPDHKAARWHDGYVRVEGEWRNVADTSTNTRLAEYRQRRDATQFDSAGHRNLARWCQRQGLRRQQQAHLVAAMELDPANPTLRRELGYVHQNGQWIHRDEIKEARQEQASYLAAMHRWQPRLTRLARRLESGDEAVMLDARHDLARIDDPYAVPVMEAAISTRGVEQATIVVDALESMPTAEATVGLARHAVLAPWARVREYAAYALAQRPAYEYLPLLITSMFGPVRLESDVSDLSDGRLLHQKVMMREGFAAHKTAVFDTFYWARNTSNPVRASLNLASAQQRIADDKTRWRSEVSQMNRQTRQLNERIASVLASVTGQELGRKPQAWWDFWYSYSDYEMPTKPYQVASYDSRPEEIVTSCECFVAGTPVWTDQGSRAIDELEVGDLVLSQDVVSGELVYQPVMKTTVRSAQTLLTLTIDDEEIVTTAGHGFWVNGAGWTRACDVRPGDLLHGVDGAREVAASTAAEPAWVFNLLVDETQTYFVGTGRCLVHDNRLFKPVRMSVPGLPMQ